MSLCVVVQLTVATVKTNIYSYKKSVNSKFNFFLKFFHFFLLFTGGFCGSFKKGLGRIIKVENRPPGSL